MIRLDLREPSDFFDFSHDPWEVRLIDKYEISSRLALILLQSGLCAAQGLLFISIDWQWLIGPLVVNLVYLAGAIVNFSMMVSMFEAITVGANLSVRLCACLLVSRELDG
uniref:Uncharacterized protein n=1 Tax=Caenorhabditis japonica TaxID=281687 RepID=A0A8R1EKF2_CAEJA